MRQEFEVEILGENWGYLHLKRGDSLSGKGEATKEEKFVSTDEKQIKHMVERFLQWKLPENFNPDGGISFKKMFNEHTDHPMKHEPVGTNLFDYTQAEQMVRYIVDGLPSASAPDRAEELAREDLIIEAQKIFHAYQCSRDAGADAVASLLREASDKCPTCGLTIVPRLCANPACASSVRR